MLFMTVTWEPSPSNYRGSSGTHWSLLRLIIRECRCNLLDVEGPRRSITIEIWKVSPSLMASWAWITTHRVCLSLNVFTALPKSHLILEPERWKANFSTHHSHRKRLTPWGLARATGFEIHCGQLFLNSNVFLLFPLP